MNEDVIKRKLLPSEIEEEQSKIILIDCSNSFNDWKGDYISVNGQEPQLITNSSDIELEIKNKYIGDKNFSKILTDYPGPK